MLLFGAALGGGLSGVPGTADAAGMLYVLPIALAAVSGGLRGGLAAGVAAVVLLHVAAGLGGESLGPAGHAARDVVLLVAAVSLGSVAERMRARAELVDALHRGLAELGHGVVVMDEHTRTLLYASDAAAAIYRRTPEELRGMAADDLAGPEDRERVHERRRLRNAGHRVPARAEISVLGPAREDIRIESALVPVSVEGERLWAAVVRDVSARRDAERRVAADRGFLQTVLDTAATPIAVLDADGAHRHGERARSSAWRASARRCWPAGRRGVSG